MSLKKTLNDYARSLEHGSAAVFVGAGLSMEAGYPSWRKLLSDIADELHIDLRIEGDLAGIAQYYLNKSGSRTQIAQLIRDELSGQSITETHRILARLPLPIVWTTSYDTLLEDAWHAQGKLIDVKWAQSQLSQRNYDAHSTLYKLHGSIEDAANVVIATDDYELFGHGRGAFMTALESDYVRQTFMFLGLSFTDHNLIHLMASVRRKMEAEKAKPAHFAILKRPDRDDVSNQYNVPASDPRIDEYVDFSLSRFNLWVDDLRLRYGIDVHVVDNHDQVRVVLSHIESEYVSRSLFVSGSSPEGRINDAVLGISSTIGHAAARANFRLVNGFGESVGRAVVSGYIGGLVHGDSIPSLDRHLIIRPFPSSEQVDGYAAFASRYREDMISQSGGVVVIGGDHGETIAPGTIEEAMIAARLGRRILPIGSTGGAARILAQRMLDLSVGPDLELIRSFLEPRSLVEVDSLFSKWIAEPLRLIEPQLKLAANLKDFHATLRSARYRGPSL